MKVSPHIKNLMVYQPGKPIDEVKRELSLSKVIKLASNENPLGLSPFAKEAILKSLDDISLYPDASCYNLTKAISNYYKIDSSFIAFGNGSEEVIDLIVRTLCEPQDVVLTFAHSFLMYKICATSVGADFIELPMGEDLKFDLKMLESESFKRANVRIIFIANPNNPTGTYVKDIELKKLLLATKKLENTYVIVDEAYNEFVRAKDYPNVSQWLNDFPNLIVIRTFSKVFGLAGLRLGILLANPEVVGFYNRLRKPFNVNTLAQVAGEAVLNDVDYIKKSREVVHNGIDYFYEQFQKMNLKFWPSQANFVLIETPFSGLEVYSEMLKLGVIVRPVGAYNLSNCLRISVGLPEENEAAIIALSKALKILKLRK